MSRERDHSAIDTLNADFERFVTSASPGLLRSAYLLTGDRGHAEDLVQVAFIRTLKRWNAISGSPAVYAGKVLINLSHDRRRAALSRPPLAPGPFASEPPAADQLDRVLERDAITQAARRLPASQREVLACRFLLDLTIAETAKTPKLPEGTVKSYTSRALNRMRELLEDMPTVSHTPSEVRDADR